MWGVVRGDFGGVVFGDGCVKEEIVPAFLGKNGRSCGLGFLDRLRVAIVCVLGSRSRSDEEHMAMTIMSKCFLAFPVRRDCVQNSCA